MTETRHETPVVPMDLPDGLEYVEPEVRELARGIAADIRLHGHWQYGQCHNDGVCLLTSPTWHRYLGRPLTEDADPIGDLVWLLTRTRSGSTLPAADWNDATPTAVVLATLDRIAEGLA